MKVSGNLDVVRYRSGWFENTPCESVWLVFTMILRRSARYASSRWTPADAHSYHRAGCSSLSCNSHLRFRYPI